MRAVVYFHGPKTAWRELVDEDEIIASRNVPNRFIGRLWARSILATLDPKRCGWAIVDDEGEQLEHCEAIGSAVE